MGICLGGLSTDCLRCVGHLIQVLICAVLTVVNNLKLSQGLWLFSECKFSPLQGDRLG